MVALEAKYHSSCIVSFYNRARAIADKDKKDDPLQVAEGIALAQLISYIEETRSESDKLPVFKLADLSNLYASRLEQLGGITDHQHVYIHTSRLKDRILCRIPDLQAHKLGRDILLAFKDDVGPALQKAAKEDYDDEAIHLARAATILRRDMLRQKNAFNGSFDQNCQENSVPIWSI